MQFRKGRMRKIFLRTERSEGTFTARDRVFLEQGETFEKEFYFPLDKAGKRWYIVHNMSGLTERSSHINVTNKQSNKIGWCIRL